MAERAAGCPLCGGVGRPAMARPPWRYLRCADCRSLWLTPRPTSDVLARHYDDGEFYRAAAGAEARQRVLARRRLARLALLAGPAPGGRSVLDVGCADGLFLEEARAAGWGVEGLEPSAALSARARTRGLPVERATLPLPSSAAPRAVVTAWEVVEHVPDPAAFVGGLADALRPGGWLGLSTPDAAGLAARVLGDRWPFASAPEHLVLFSRPALVTLLAAHGLEVVATRGFSGLGLSEAAGMLRRRAGTAGALLAPAVAGAFALLDRIGHGTEFELYARKVEARP